MEKVERTQYQAAIAMGTLFRPRWRKMGQKLDWKSSFNVHEKIIRTK